MFEFIVIPLQQIHLVQESFKVNYLKLCKLINMVTRIHSTKIFLILSRIETKISIFNLLHIIHFKYTYLIHFYHLKILSEKKVELIPSL